MNTLETLKQFCETGENTRWSITEPYAYGGFTYATDTKILARAAGELVENNLESGKRFPPVIEKSTCDWDNVFPLKSSHQIHNPEILKKRKKCGECNGSGDWYCGCPDCQADHKCECCKGEGKLPAIDEFKIHNRHFDPHYIELVLTLPNAKVFVDGNKLFFEGGGIQGLIMSFDPDYKRPA